MDKKLLKQVLLALIYFLSLNLGFFYLKITLFKDVDFLSTLIPFLIFFLLGVVFFILLTLSKPSFKLQIPIYILVFASILLWFGTNGYIIAGGIMFIFFLFLSQMNLKKEEKNLLKFNFRRISHEGYRAFLTGAAIFLSILFFMSPKIFGGKIILPRSLFDLAWPALERTYSVQFPGFFGDMTVDQFIILQMSENTEEIVEKYTQPQIEDQSSAPSLPFAGESIEIELRKELQRELDKAKKGISKEMLQEAREDFAEAFKIDRKLKGNEKLKDLFYETTNNLILQSIQSWERIGTIGVIFAFFLLMKTVSIFLNYILLLISWLFFKILLAMDFFKIKTIQVEKEELIL